MDSYFEGPVTAGFSPSLKPEGSPDCGGVLASLELGLPVQPLHLLLPVLGVGALNKRLCPLFRFLKTKQKHHHLYAEGHTAPLH